MPHRMKKVLSRLSVIDLRVYDRGLWPRLTLQHDGISVYQSLWKEVHEVVVNDRFL